MGATMYEQDLLERVYSGKRALLKRQILAQALDCFLEQGIETTTIEQICEHSGASVGAVYNHFKNKEGIVRALYLAALQDQSQQRMHALHDAQGIQQGIAVLIHSYIAWTVQHPQFARFLYTARSSFNTVTQADIEQQNQQRNQYLLLWIDQQLDRVVLEHIPYELLFSLVIGATESYCRAWLSGRVQSSPLQYQEQLARSAWDSIRQSDLG